MIYADTREKKNGHITKYFDKHNIKYMTKVVRTGDYINPDNPKVIIERKQNLLEIATNITQDHDRFKRELARLDNIDGKMYILIEEKIGSLEDVQKWVSPLKHDGTPYTKMTGNVLYKYMVSWQFKHNIEYIFCDKDKTAIKILELLEGDSPACNK